MLAHARHIYEEALTLSPREKVELIEHLYFSLDSQSTREKLDKMWTQEAKNRLAAYDAGKVGTTPASEVFAEIARMKTP